MKQFDLPHLVGIHRKMDTARDNLKGDNATLERSDTSSLLRLLKEIEAYCDEVHFHHASSKAFGIHLDLKRSPQTVTGMKLAAHFEDLRTDMDICMFSHRFIQVVGDGR